MVCVCSYILSAAGAARELNIQICILDGLFLAFLLSFLSRAPLSCPYQSIRPHSNRCNLQSLIPCCLPGFECICTSREAAYDLKTYFTPPPHLTFDPPCSLACIPTDMYDSPDARTTGGTHTAGAAAETERRAELGGKRSRRTARSLRRKYVVELGSVRSLCFICFMSGRARYVWLAWVPVRSK